jgi:F0F1-type ATP synthase membrane subunit b/b'
MTFSIEQLETVLMRARLILSTGEFWVAVAFLIALVVAVKFIFPKVSSALAQQQQTIADRFLEVEQRLALAEKKYAQAKSNMETLTDQLSRLDAEFDLKVSEVLNNWNAEKEVLLKKHAVVFEKNLGHVENHVRVKFLDELVNISCAALETTLKKVITPKKHDLVLLKNIETLKMIKTQ